MIDWLITLDLCSKVRKHNFLKFEQINRNSFGIDSLLCEIVLKIDERVQVDIPIKLFLVDTEDTFQSLQEMFLGFIHSLVLIELIGLTLHSQKFLT